MKCLVMGKRVSPPNFIWFERTKVGRELGVTEERMRGKSVVRER